MTLTKIPDYDPSSYVYVEVLNSWDKEITRLLLSKTESFHVNGGTSEEGNKIRFAALVSYHNRDFVQAIRNILKKLSAKVIEVIKTVKFGAMGVRNLFDDDSESNKDLTTVCNAIDMSGVNRQVVSRFAALGSRVLDL
jgi:hypothetical protein